MTTSGNIPSRKRYLSPRFLIGKMREKGVVWCLKVAIAKVSRGVRGYANRLIKRISWVFPSMRFLLCPAAQSEKRVLAICDFRTMPYTVGELLYFQEMTLISRLEHNVEKVDIVWLCDPNNRARSDQGPPENYYHYLSPLLPLAHVNPHLGSFMLMDSQEALETYITDNLDRYHIFPPAKDIFGLRFSYREYYKRTQNFYAKHGFVPHLSCKPSTLLWGRSFIAQEVRPHLPVVVQLRNRGDHVWRNIRPESWLEFFAFCEDRFDVKFIVIGSKEEIDPRFRSLSNVVFSKDYCTTVEQDMALLQISLMYIGPCSGPNLMAWFSDVPYVIFSFETTYVTLPHGSGHLPWATPLQKLVWEPETTELLIDEFTNLFHCINTSRWAQEFDRLARDSGARLKRWPELQ